MGVLTPPLASKVMLGSPDVYKRQVMRYPRAIPAGRVLQWEDVGRFAKGRYLLMHSVIYRTQLLRESGLDLPHHTF